MDTSVMGRRERAVRVALIVAGLTGVASLVSACQSDPDIDITAYAQTIEPADVLYNQGLANVQAGQLTEASRKFEAVDKQHPYSEYARKAMVMRRVHRLPPGPVFGGDQHRAAAISVFIPMTRMRLTRNILSGLPITGRSRR
jgi:hypothetical protein